MSTETEEIAKPVVVEDPKLAAAAEEPDSKKQKMTIPQSPDEGKPHETKISYVPQ